MLFLLGGVIARFGTSNSVVLLVEALDIGGHGLGGEDAHLARVETVLLQVATELGIFVRHEVSRKLQF